MKVLFLTASPTYVILDKARADGTDEVEYPKLDLWPELREITDVLFEARADGYADLEIVPEVRTEDLTRYLARNDVNILHFSGHGDLADQDPEEVDKEANLIMQGDYGAGEYVPNTWLKEQISNKGINIVILNCCWSGPIAEQLQGTADLVIGTTEPLRTDIAVEFSRTFYQAAQEGLPISNILEKVKTKVGGDLYVYLQRDDSVLDNIVLPTGTGDSSEGEPSDNPAQRILRLQKKLENARENLSTYLRDDLIYVLFAFLIALGAHSIFSQWGCDECTWQNQTAENTCPVAASGCQKTCTDCGAETFDLPKLWEQVHEYLAKLITDAKWLKYEPFALMGILAAGPLARLAAAIPIALAANIGRKVLPLMGAQSRERILFYVDEAQFSEMETWVKEFES